MGKTAKSGFLASGTLVAPEWVLTAAHVVDNAKTLSFTIGGQTYEVDRTVVYPGWNGDLWSGCDIGLVHLAKPVDNIKPAPLYTGSGEMNHAETVVGFGKTGTGSSGDTKCDGLKRGGRRMSSARSKTSVSWWPISTNHCQLAQSRSVIRMRCRWKA